MRLLMALLAASGLAGCVAYGGGVYGASDAYYGNSYGYDNGARGTYSDRSYDRDRDRDGDGVPNRSDRAPNDPRRY